MMPTRLGHTLQPLIGAFNLGILKRRFVTLLSPT